MRYLIFSLLSLFCFSSCELTDVVAAVETADFILEVMDDDYDGYYDRGYDERPYYDPYGEYTGEYVDPVREVYYPLDY